LHVGNAQQKKDSSQNFNNAKSLGTGHHQKHYEVSSQTEKCQKGLVVDSSKTNEEQKILEEEEPKLDTCQEGFGKQSSITDPCQKDLETELLETNQHKKVPKDNSSETEPLQYIEKGSLRFDLDQEFVKEYPTSSQHQKGLEDESTKTENCQTKKSSGKLMETK